MARLKHETTGVIVSIDDSKVDRLGNEWVAADDETTKRRPARPKKSAE